MTKPIARDRIYRRRSFNAEIIELCVRWYASYRLSYRDLVELMADRGVAVSHTTIMRWVIRYVPEFLLRPDRGIAAAQAFFRKALTLHPRGPRKVTLDGHVPSRRASWRLRGGHPHWRKVEVRTCKYLNNMVEPDHRAIRRR